MKKNILILLIYLFAASFVIKAQEQQKQQESQNTKPLELPDIFIEGKAQMNFHAGSKQFPEKPPAMSKNELDSINTLEKKQSFLLPAQSMPEKVINREFSKGFLNASLANYFTPSLEGGYEMNLEGYNLFTNAGFESSSGDAKNSSYNKSFMQVSSDYIAPDKYFIFGGSRTRATLAFNNRNLSLYADTNSPNRNLLSLLGSIESEGAFSGWSFRTGASYKIFKINQIEHNAGDNQLKGYLNLLGNFEQYLAGGSLLLDFHSLRGNSVNFMQLNGSVKYQKNDYVLSGIVGVQSVVNSKEENKVGAIFQGEINYFINQNFTFKGGVSTGRENNSLSLAIQKNPYLSDTAVIDYTLKNILWAGLYYHPNERISASLGVRVGNSNNLPFYINSNNSTFLIIYEKALFTDIFAEAELQLTQKDNFDANITLNNTFLDSNNHTAPYTIPFKASIFYERKWNDKFGTKIGLNYIGMRYSDIENINKLSAYINLNAEVDYNVDENFMLNVFTDNLTNSNIYIYNGYKERGIFIGAGILWKF